MSCLAFVGQTQSNAEDTDETSGQDVLSLSPCRGLQCKAAEDLQAAYDAMETCDRPDVSALRGGQATYQTELRETRILLDHLPYNHRNLVPFYCA